MKIIAISDLHGKFPEIPKPCDVLIVAGDLCPDGFGRVWARHSPALQYRWFVETFVPWARKQAPFVLVTWGNHDFCGHSHYEEEFGISDAIANEGIIQVAVDQQITVHGLKIWMTPWSNQFMNWAFMKPHEELAAVYAKIPEGIDILVSHQPPQGYGDLYPNLATGQLEHIASRELLDAIERVTPKVVVCGHLHGGYGTYMHGETIIHNVSVVNEQYQLVNPATELVCF